MQEPRSEDKAIGAAGPKGLKLRHLKWAFLALAIGLIAMILYLFDVAPADIAHTVTRCVSCH